jgi:hypothetical protein
MHTICLRKIRSLTRQRSSALLRRMLHHELATSIIVAFDQLTSFMSAWQLSQRR